MTQPSTTSSGDRAVAFSSACWGLCSLAALTGEGFVRDSVSAASKCLVSGVGTGARTCCLQAGSRCGNRVSRRAGPGGCRLQMAPGSGDGAFRCHLEAIHSLGGAGSGSLEHATGAADLPGGSSVRERGGSREALALVSGGQGVPCVTVLNVLYAALGSTEGRR